MKHTRYIILILLFSSIMAPGCENLLQPVPQGQVALDDLMTSESGMNTALNGVYQPLQNLYKNNLPRLLIMASDDGWTWRKETEPDIYIVEQTYHITQTIWTGCYTGITRANTILDRMEGITFSSPEAKDALEGQARFMRAFYYFKLVRLFGGVPLILKEIKTREDAEQPRASIEDIYAQIKSDINEALELLPPVYTGGGPGMEVGRPTSYAASALKSLVHLELEEWNEAAAAAEVVINNNELGLLADYASNFNGSDENGQGSLFEIQYGGVTGQTTTNLSSFYAPPDLNGSAAVLPSDDMLNGKGGGLSSGHGFVQIFDPGDKRKDVILQHYGLANFIDPSMPDGSLYYLNKFYNTSDPQALSTWNFPLIRYAEILLVGAEALNEAAYMADGVAFDLLNKTRINAGLEPLTSAELPGQDAFREALRKERRIELSFEIKRYYDLNRWGILQDWVQSQMDYLGLSFPAQRLITHPLTGKEYYLYPIPSIEFVNNAQLGEQNPGY